MQHQPGDKIPRHFCHTDAYRFPEPCPNSGAAVTKAPLRVHGQFQRFHPRLVVCRRESQPAAHVSQVRIARHELGREATDRQQLLAMPEMRRCVEPVAAGGRIVSTVGAVTRRASVATLTETMIQLSDLIAALDRRLPQVQRLGEVAIANASARLRRDAFERIREIERDIADRESNDPRPAETL